MAIVPAASFLAFFLLILLLDSSFGLGLSSDNLESCGSAFLRFDGGIRFCRFKSRAVASCQAGQPSEYWMIDETPTG